MKIIEGRRPGEVVFGAILLTFSVWLFWRSYQISGFSSLSGSGVFPMLASSVMIVSGIFIVAKSIKMDAPRDDQSSAISYLIPLRLLVFVPMMMAFAAAMPQIGFFPAATIFVFIAILFLWRKSIVKTILITAISVTAIYVIFRILFKVVLPSGALWL